MKAFAFLLREIWRWTPATIFLNRFRFFLLLNIDVDTVMKLLKPLPLLPLLWRAETVTGPTFWNRETSNRYAASPPSLLSIIKWYEGTTQKQSSLLFCKDILIKMLLICLLHDKSSVLFQDMPSNLTTKTCLQSSYERPVLETAQNCKNVPIAHIWCKTVCALPSHLRSCKHWCTFIDGWAVADGARRAPHVCGRLVIFQWVLI